MWDQIIIAIAVNQDIAWYLESRSFDGAIARNIAAQPGWSDFTGPLWHGLGAQWLWRCDFWRRIWKLILWSEYMSADHFPDRVRQPQSELQGLRRKEELIHTEQTNPSPKEPAITLESREASIICLDFLLPTLASECKFRVGMLYFPTLCWRKKWANILML